MKLSTKVYWALFASLCAGLVFAAISSAAENFSLFGIVAGALGQKASGWWKSGLLGFFLTAGVAAFWIVLGERQRQPGARRLTTTRPAIQLALPFPAPILVKRCTSCGSSDIRRQRGRWLRWVLPASLGAMGIAVWATWPEGRDLYGIEDLAAQILLGGGLATAFIILSWLTSPATICNRCGSRSFRYRREVSRSAASPPRPPGS